MIRAFFDGCCEPINPGGTAAYGAIIFKDGVEIWKASEIFRPVRGKELATSNNVAEYSGFEAILNYLIEHGLKDQEIHISGDSNLVIQQMRGHWRIRQGFYVPVAQRCRELVRKFLNLKLTWIPREENTFADKLSKQELVNAGVKFRIQPKR